MINQDVLSEKMKYLILMNAKPEMFEVFNVSVEFEFTDQTHTKIQAYDIDIKFDYHGALDFEFNTFTHEIRTMSEKLTDVLHQYTFTKDGKIVRGENSNCWSSGPLVFNIDYAADEKHIFELGYRFHYDD